MDRWLAISDGATAALHALAYAASQDGPVPAKAVAKELGVSPSYLAKLVQSLVRADLAEATRGATGGFSVKGSPAKMSCLDVVVAIDGPVPERACLFEEATCARKTCAFKTLCSEIGKKARETLAKTSVLELSKSY